jgi:hypothetical protein
MEDSPHPNAHPAPGIRESFFPLAKGVAGIPLPATFFLWVCQSSRRCGIA